MSEDTERDSDWGLSEADPVSRRGFLVSSSAVALGTGLGNAPSNDVNAAVTPAEIVLSEADLAEQTGESYVDRSGDPATTPLVRHLAESVPGFSAASGAVSGFVARGSPRRVPLYVESAAFDASRVPFASIADATGGWIRSIYGGSAVRSVEVDHRQDIVTWTVVTRDGWQDSLTVQRLGRLSLFAVAYGRWEASVNPGAVVEQSARIMQDRVA